MNLFNLFKKRKNGNKIDSQPVRLDCGSENSEQSNDQDVYLENTTINRVPIQNIDENDIYPWANDLVFNNEITIGNIILLWWLDKYWDKKRDTPQYFNLYYVTDFKTERRRLNGLGYIELSGKLTVKGHEALESNFKYVELHRNNWTTPEEKEKNHQIYLEEMDKHNTMLRNIGLKDLADRNEVNILKEKTDESITKPFYHAEKLSKAGEVEESLAILIPLLEKAATIEPYYRGMIVERIAINFRKAKLFSEEVSVLTRYLTSMTSDESFIQYKEKFEKRLIKAKSLEDKKFEQV